MMIILMGMSMRVVVGRGARVATKTDEGSYQNNDRKSVQSPERIWVAKQQAQYVGYHSSVNQHSNNEEDPLNQKHIVDKAKGESKGNQLEDRGRAQSSFAKRPSKCEAVGNLS